MSHEARLDRLVARMGEEGLDALLVTHLVNVRYACGYVGSNGVLLLTRERRVLLTDFRYLTASRERTRGVEVVDGGKDLFTRVEEILPDAAPGGRVGFEADHMSVSRYGALATQAADLEWVPTSGIVEALRLHKEPGEVALIARAAAIADIAFAACRDGLFAGRTEREVAWELEGIMRREGAEEASFDIIVASGPRGAMPHAVPAAEPILRDTLVTVDMGARLEGYASDCTRTFATGTPPEELLLAYDLCLAAQEKALAAVRPGISGGDLDAVAREHIVAAGYGEVFRHGLGHGVGLDVHEPPYARKGIVQELEAGMTVTIEPGIYLEGLGGVRIEDLIVVSDDGPRVLTGFTKERLKVDS